MLRNCLVLTLLLCGNALLCAQQISVFCPAMDVKRLEPKKNNIWQCAREVGTATIKLPGEPDLEFGEFVIPPTLVRPTNKRFKRLSINFVVDACTQFGFSAQMDQLSISLPAEYVSAGRAQPMKASVLLTRSDGREFRGFVVYPTSVTSRVGIGWRKASEVNATGALMLP